MALKRLTDIGSATGVTLSDFIHIVITGDTSQDPAGSSYKASLQQVYDVFNISNSVFTGNTSATCITDLYVTNLNSCSPLYIQPTNVGDVLIGSGGDVNVGIGTTSPTAKLHILTTGTTEGTNALQVGSSSSSNILRVIDNGAVMVNSDWANINATVGIRGVAGITNTLQVYSSGYTREHLRSYKSDTTSGTLIESNAGGIGVYNLDGTPSIGFGTHFAQEGFLLNTRQNIKALGSIGLFYWTDTQNFIEFNSVKNVSESKPYIRVRGGVGGSNQGEYQFHSTSDSYVGVAITGTVGNFGVGTSGPTEKLDVVGNVNITGQIYIDIPPTHIPSGTSQTINWDDGNYQIIDLDSATGNVTLTFTNAKAGAVYSLQVIQGSVTRSLVYPGSIKWEGGTPLVPTSGNDAIDLITMVYNGTNFLASYGSAYS